MLTIASDNHSAQARRHPELLIPINASFAETARWKRRVPRDFPGGLMQTLLQDLRYGGRILLKNPGFTLIAVFTLALGIGANTAIFGLMDKLMVRSLPVKEPSRLVLLQSEGLTPGLTLPEVSWADYNDYRA